MSTGQDHPQPADRYEDTIKAACWTILSHWSASLNGRRAPGNTPTTGTREPPMPVPADVLDKRRDTTVSLAGWADVITTGRDLSDAPNGQNTVELARFVDRHAAWLAQEAGTAAASELRTHAGRIRGLALQIRVRRYVLKNGHRTYTCIADHITPDGDRTACDGEFYAVLRDDDDLLPSQIHCTRNMDHTWDPHDWLTLGRALHAAAG